MSNEQATQWISVQDQKPEQGVEVLISGYWYGKPESGRWYDAAQWDGNEWRDTDPDNPQRFDYVTHWRPLPPGPEDGEANGA